MPGTDKVGNTDEPDKSSGLKHGASRKPDQPRVAISAIRPGSTIFTIICRRPDGAVSVQVNPDRQSRSPAKSVGDGLNQWQNGLLAGIRAAVPWRTR